MPVIDNRPQPTIIKIVEKALAQIEADITELQEAGYQVWEPAYIEVSIVGEAGNLTMRHTIVKESL